MPSQIKHRNTAKIVNSDRQSILIAFNCSWHVQSSISDFSAQFHLQPKLAEARAPQFLPKAAPVLSYMRIKCAHILSFPPPISLKISAIQLRKLRGVFKQDNFICPRKVVAEWLRVRPRPRGARFEFDMRPSFDYFSSTLEVFLDCDYILALVLSNFLP